MIRVAEKLSMNQLQSLCGSKADAAVLLDAWERGDLLSLHGHLRSAARTKSTAETPSLEMERIELLDGIADSMRHALAQNTIAGYDLEISVQLLRHLVRTN